MAICSIGTKIQTLTSGAASLELIGALTDRILGFEIHVTLESAPGASSEFGLGQSSTPGIGPTLLTSRFEDAATGLTDTFPSIATAWVTGPTLPGNFWRTCVLDNVVGAGVVWQFPNGLVVPPTGSIVLWNLSAVGAADVSLVWDD